MLYGLKCTEVHQSLCYAFNLARKIRLQIKTRDIIAILVISSLCLKNC